MRYLAAWAEEIIQEFNYMYDCNITTEINGEVDGCYILSMPSLYKDKISTRMTIEKQNNMVFSYDSFKYNIQQVLIAHFLGRRDPMDLYVETSVRGLPEF